MMAAAALEAATAFDREDVSSFACKTLERLWKELWTPDHGMWHALADGRRKIRGLLEDHIFLVDAFLAAQNATGDPKWLRRADELMAFVLKHFWDEERKGFVDLASDLYEGGEVSLREIRRRPLEDSPYAGANAVAALCLQRLHALTGNDDYRLHHDQLILASAGEASRYGPIFCGTYFLAAELWLHPPTEIVIVGPRKDATVRALQSAAWHAFAPGKTILLASEKDSYVPDAMDHMRKAAEARAGPVAFVCQGTTCSMPTEDPDALRALLRSGKAG